MIAIDPRQPVHATCVAVAGCGVLILGPSGSGKSDLGLRLIDRGAQLVADDWVLLEETASTIIARPPPEIAGLIEVRGLGIIQTGYTDQCTIRLAVVLVDRDNVPRLPEPELLRFIHESVPMLRLHAFDLTTPLKIEHALKSAPIRE